MMPDHQLPRGWQSIRLSDLASVVRGSSPRPAGDPKFFNGDFIPWVTVADVTGSASSVVRRTASKLTEAGAGRTRILEPGTLLLTNSGATLGVPKILGVRAGANDGVAALLGLKGASAWYLLYFLETQTRIFRERIAPGVGQPNLNTELIGDVRLSLPPLREQRQIVAVLKHWDRAIRKSSRLLKLKGRLKRGLMQQLLIGRRRFPEFAGQSWQEVRLRDIAESISIRNRGVLSREMVMAVTKASGIVPMKPELIGGSIDRYQVVQPNDFAYNPMRLNIGSIARWRGSGDVLVSPDYVVFRCRAGKLDPDFLDQFRRSHAWSSFMSACGNGSVRVRIWFDDLGVLKLKLPPLAEQRKIAAVLSSADREIELLEQLLSAQKEQKRGLMQKLLTGRVRLPKALREEVEAS